MKSLVIIGYIYVFAALAMACNTYPPYAEITNYDNPVVEGQTAYFTGTGYSRDGGSISYQWDFPPEAYDIQNDNTTNASCKFSLAGDDYLVTFTVKSSTGSSTPVTCMVDVSEPSGTWHVSVDGNDDDSGQSLQTALATIQTAIDRADDGDEIVIGSGTYYESIDLKNKNITITSTNPNDAAVVAATIIDGYGLGSTVTFGGNETSSCKIEGITITGGYPVGDSLSLHLAMDDGAGSTLAADSSGKNRDGTLENGPVWTSEGFVDGALVFDGTDDYVEVSDYQGVTGQGARTCSAWIKTTVASKEIISWGSEEGNGYRWIIRVNEGGQLRAEVQGGNIIGTTIINDGVWHHVAVVVEDDGSPNITEAKLYVDGQLETVSASVDEPINTGRDQNVRIGMYYVGQRYFNGSIDDVKVYSRSLRADEITLLAGETSTDLDPVAHWKLDGNSSDATGNGHNGTLSTALDAPVYDHGVSGEAIRLDSDQSQYITVPHDMQLKPQLPLTISTWVYLTESGTNGVFVQTDHWGDTTYAGAYMRMKADFSDRIALGYGDGSGTSYSAIRVKTGTTVLLPNRWYHVVGVIRGYDDMSIYINGKDDGGACSGGGSGNLYYTSEDISIGSINGSSAFFKGKIDDVRIYNYGLTEATVQEVYQTRFADGGGIQGRGATATISKCVIEGNKSETNGGGIANIDGQIADSYIIQNESLAAGGGLADCKGDIVDCTISDNKALYAGGMYNYKSQTQVLNCKFTYNTALETGGAVYNLFCGDLPETQDEEPDLIFQNCEFIGNIDLGNTPAAQTITLKSVIPEWSWSLEKYGNSDWHAGWTDQDGDENVWFNNNSTIADYPVIGQDGQEYRVYWGIPYSGSTYLPNEAGYKSGLGFTGYAPPDRSITLGVDFELGRLSHTNNTIHVDSTTSGMDLAISLTIGNGLMESIVKEFQFELTVNETPIPEGETENPPDDIYFPLSYPSELIEIDNKAYILEIRGFTDQLDSVFSSPEDGTNTTDLWARITQPPVEASLKNLASTVQIENCVFVGNNAENSNGGALANWSCERVFIGNSTIVGNHGNFCGGVYNHESEVEVVNSILWGNTDNTEITDLNYSLLNQQIYNVNTDCIGQHEGCDSQCTVIYSCVQDDSSYSLGVEQTPGFSHDDVARQAIIGFVVQSSTSFLGDDVEILGSWTDGTSHAVEQGDDRVLIFTVHAEDLDDNNMEILHITYGEQELTKIIEWNQESASLGYRAFVGAYYLKETGMNGATNNDFVVTWAEPPSATPAYSSVFLGNVNQTTSIGEIEGNGITLSPAAASSVETSPVLANYGDMTIFAGTVNNPGTCTVDNGFIEAIELTAQFGDGVVGYKILQNNRLMANQGNILVDPLFIQAPYPGPDGEWDGVNDDYGDLRLQAGSPCIDAGYNGEISPTATDLAGNLRRVDDLETEPDPGDITGASKPVVDLGAYEYEYESQVDNTAPFAVDDVLEFRTDELIPDALYPNGYIEIGINSLLANDEDVDLDIFTFDETVIPPAGVLEPISGGFKYSPDFSGTGTDTFTYVIYDGIAISNEATVTITIVDPGGLTVNAGSSQTVTLNSNGTALVTLHDAFVAGDGVINPGATNITKTWTDTGVGTYIPPTGSVDWHSHQNELRPTITLELTDPEVFSYMEIVQFMLQLEGTDGSRSDTGSVIITVLPPNDGFQTGPQVDAGTYDSLVWPEDSVFLLDGTVTDDGLPFGVLSYQWKVVEAVGGDAIFDDASAEDTTVNFTGQGRYTLRLTATDLQNTGQDEVMIVIGTPPLGYNEPPTAQITADEAHQNDLSETSLNLSNTAVALPIYLAATDENIGALTYTWSLVPFNGTPVNGVSFNDFHVAEPEATFTEIGDYQIQVEVSDGQYSAYDTLTVSVSSSSNPVTFTVEAGEDQEIELPAYAHLFGSYTPNQTVDANDVEFHWYLLNGPAEVDFVEDSDRQLHAKAEFAEPGTYTFRLEVNINGISPGIDDVSVIVKQRTMVIGGSSYASFIADSTKNSALWSFGQIYRTQGSDLGQTIPTINIDPEYPPYINSNFWHHTCVQPLKSFNFPFPTPVLSFSASDQEQLRNIVMLDSGFQSSRAYSLSLALDKEGHIWGWGSGGSMCAEGFEQVFSDGKYAYLATDHPYFNNTVMRYTFEEDDWFDSWESWSPGWALPLPVLDPGTGLPLEDFVWISSGNSSQYKAVDINGHAWARDQTSPGYVTFSKVLDGDGEPIQNICQAEAARHAGVFLEKLIADDIACNGRVLAYKYLSTGALLGRDIESAGWSTRLPDYVMFPDLDNDGTCGTEEGGDRDIYGADHLCNIVKIETGEFNAFALEKIDPDNPSAGGHVYNGHVYTWGDYYNNNNDPVIRLYGNTVYDNLGPLWNYAKHPILVQAGEQFDSDFLKYIVDISVGTEHCIAVEEIDSDLGVSGYVYTWGKNQYGQLGNGNNGDAVQVLPVKVVAPDLDGDSISDAAEYGDTHLKNIIKVKAGYSHCFALDVEGNLYAWGKGDNYQLGTGSNAEVNSVPRLVQYEKKVHNVDTGKWYYKIQDAINDEETEDGHHIVVSPGIYYESIEFYDEEGTAKSVTLTSEDPGNPDIVRTTIISVLDDNGSGVPDLAVTIKADSGIDLSSVISGFTIRGSISVDGTSARINEIITISNNIITDVIGTGTNPVNPAANGTGIDIRNAAAVRIRNNQIVGNTLGIDIEDSGVTVRNNTIADNSEGVNVTGTNSLRFLNNIVWENGTNSLSDNISVISDYYFCCVGGLSGTPDTNGNFGANPFEGNNAGDYSLPSNSPCINTGFMDTVVSGDADSFVPTRLACYQVGDVIEINNDWIPRTIAGIDTEIGFSAEPSSLPVIGETIINWGPVDMFTDTTSADGTASTVVVADVSKYTNGDRIKIGSDHYAHILYVDLQGQITFTPALLSGESANGTSLTVWKLSDVMDINGDPRVVNGRVDIGADEVCPWHVNAGRDKTVTVSEQCDTSGASVKYAGFPGVSSGNIALQWSVVKEPAVSDVIFGESNRLITDTVHTSVNFNDHVGQYILQLTVIEDGLPVAWDTVNVNVLYAISYTGDLDIVLPDIAQILLNVEPSSEIDTYNVQWKAPITDWYGRDVSFDDESSKTVNVTFESAGYYPLTVELTDKDTDELVGQQTIVVTAKNSFIDVIIESDKDEIVLPYNSITFEGHVEGVLGDYSPEWVVTSSDPDKQTLMTNYNSWSTEIFFDESGSYEVSLVVKECDNVGLQLPRFSIIGASTKTIEVKRSSVDAGEDQIIEWPQDFVYLFGQAEEADTYSWTCDTAVDFTPSEDPILNPKVTFPEKGLYTLTLNASNNGEAMGSDTVNIFVLSPGVEVEAGVDKTGKIGEEIILSDGTTTPSNGFSSYGWYLSTQEGELVPLSDPATFDNAGTYQVFLSVENETGFSMDGLLVTVEAWGGIESITSPDSVEFKDRETVQLAGVLDGDIYSGQVLPNGFTAEWSADAGEVQAHPDHPNDPLQTQVSFSEPGFHQVRLDIIDDNGVCIDTEMATIFVKSPTISVNAKVNGVDEYVQSLAPSDTLIVNLTGIALGDETNIEYSWSVTPAESATFIGQYEELDAPLQGTTANIELSAVGIYELTLKAYYNSTVVAHDTATVVLQTPYGQPMVRAGRNYPVAVVGDSFLLNKARIWDIDGSIIPTGIEWLCTSSNAADVTWSTDNATWSSTHPLAQNPYVKFASEGRYDFELKYTDGDTYSDSDTMSIFVQPNYQIIAGSQELIYPYTDFKMDKASVTPKSSRYSYKWSCEPPDAKIKFDPDQFSLNPTVQFEETGDYTLTLEVSKGDLDIGSNSATIQVLPNLLVDNISPEITGFEATYNNGIDVQGESNVRGDIQITVKAEDDNLDRIELSLVEGENSQTISGGTLTITSGTLGYTTGLERTKLLDTYLSGAVTLKARAIDRSGNVAEQTKTFTSIHSIRNFTVTPEMFESINNASDDNDNVTFDGILNTALPWTIDVAPGTGQASGGLNDPVYATGELSTYGITQGGKYTATLSTGQDTATVTFDVITDGIEINQIKAQLVNGEHKDSVVSGAEIPLEGHRITIEEGIYDLKGLAYYGSPTSHLNSHVKYRLLLEDSSGTRKNVTPGLLDSEGYCQNYVTGEIVEHLSFGEIDFSNIPNGIYTLDLEVECLGARNTDSIGIAVSTPLKVGHVKFSQEDLSINLGGYPISVIRTYDGLTRDRKGDFGYGWTYSLANMDIELNETRIDRGSYTLRSGDIYNRDVTLTLPTGERVAFSSHYDNDYKLVYSIPKNSGVSGFTSKDEDTIEAETKGVSTYLSWSSDERGITTEYLDYMFECLSYHDVSGYTLTMEDGTVYHIERQPYEDPHIFTIPVLEGFFDEEIFISEHTPYGKPYLQSIDLPTGEIIVFELLFASEGGDIYEKPTIKAVWQFPADIWSYSFDGNATPGETTDIEKVKAAPSEYRQYASGSIYIARDPDNNRITAIYPPSELDYEPENILIPDAVPYVRYNSDNDYGNLTLVEKLKTRGTAGDGETAEGNSDYEETTYEYEDARHTPNEHYVTAIKDKRGLAPIRYEYDGEGRLVATIDAKGNRIKIQHNVIGDQKMETVTDRNGNITDYIYNNRGNVICTNKYDNQSIFQSQMRYTYADTTNPDSPTEVGLLVDLTNPSEADYPDHYNVTRTIYYSSSNSKAKYSIDALWNITAYVYDGENLTQTTQLAWNTLGVPAFSAWDYTDLQDLTLTLLTNTYGYTELSTSENTYTDNDQLKTTETKDGQKWYSMSIMLYDDQNRVTDTIQIDADVITAANIGTFRDIASVNALQSPDLMGNHVITSYRYDEVYPVGHPKAGLPISISSDQPYSVSDPYAPGQAPKYRQFSYYDANNRQVASWYCKDGMRILSLSDLDAQGRNKRSIQVVEETTDIPEFDTIFGHIDTYIGDKEAIIQSETKYNSIGKVWTSQGQHLPHEKGSLTVYAYDEVGQLVETRTYANADDYVQSNPNNGVLTISRTLYDAEGRTLVSVGPYAPGDEPTGTETVYDSLGRVVETRRWADVQIDFVNLYGTDGSIVGLRLPASAKPANAWDYTDSQPDNIGWTANGGELPVLDQEISYSRSVYNSAGQVKTSITLDGTGYEQPTSYEYDTAGRQIAVIDPLGHDKAWNESGELTSAETSLEKGHRSETEYEGTRRKYAYDAGAFWYDDNQDPPYGYSYGTEFKYDVIGRVTTTVHPPTDYVDEEGVSKTNMPTYTHTVYDGLGRKLWDMAQVSYSDDDLQAMVGAGTYDTFIANHAKQYDYDIAGRLITVILPRPDPDNNDVLTHPVYHYYYDQYGNQTCILDPLGRATVFEYDDMNRLVAKYMPYGTNFRPSVNGIRPVFRDEDTDPANDILSQKPAIHPVEIKEFDTEGHLLAEKDYEGQVTIYYYYHSENYNTDGIKGLPGQLRYKDFYTAANDPILNGADIPDADDENTTPDNRYAFIYDNRGRIKTQTITDNTSGSAVLTYQSGTSYDSEGRVDVIITRQAGIDGVLGDYKMIEYDYNAITGQRISTRVSTSSDGAFFTLTDETGYSYDPMGRLETVSNGQTTATYGYTPVGSRESIEVDTNDEAGFEFKTDYYYNALNRLTDLVNLKTVDLDTVQNISSFNYTLKADGMRAGVNEAVDENRYLKHEYDNLNRLTHEYSDNSELFNVGNAVPLDDPLRGYKAVYTYDLVGNRQSRMLTVRRDAATDAERQYLCTTYDYDEVTDRLEQESNSGSACAVIPFGDDQRVYAYASAPGSNITYQLPGSDSRIGQFKAFLLGLPSVVNSVLFYTLVMLIPVVFLWPVFVRQWVRIRGSIDPLASPNLRLWHRMLCVLLAYIFLVGPEAFHMLARADVQYSNLSRTAWGNAGDTITYGYDDNGSMISKITVNGATTTESIVYHYNLQNRLWKVETTSYTAGVADADIRITEYRYNASGVRIQSYSYDMPDSGASVSNETVTDYLIDPANPTGYAQVIEEITDDGTDLRRVQYMLGDDVLAQTRSERNDGTDWGSYSRQYLLYDGHGSTRQLASVSDDEAPVVTVNDSYSYDGYGVMLSDSSGSGADAAASAQTNLLYSGEQYDSNMDQYYLRARYYNPTNGVFNRVDPYSGNMQDPQSLHKYAYCHNNPVNNIDPTGMMANFSLGGVLTAASISGLIGGIIGGVLGGIAGGVKGAIYGAIFGAAISFVAALGVILGGAYVIAPLLGVSTLTGIFIGHTLVTAAFAALGIKSFMNAETAREKWAIGLGLVILLAFWGYGAYRYSSISSGKGTYENLNPNATPEEIGAGKALADSLKLDLVSRPPTGSRGAGTADFQIRFSGGKAIELKNVSNTQSESGLAHTISHAQASDVAVITKPGQFSEAVMRNAAYRAFGTSSKQNVIVFEEAGEGYVLKTIIPNTKK